MAEERQAAIDEYLRQCVGEVVRASCNAPVIRGGGDWKGTLLYDEERKAYEVSELKFKPTEVVSAPRFNVRPGGVSPVRVFILSECESVRSV